MAGKKGGKDKKNAKKGNFRVIPYLPENVETSITLLSTNESEILAKALTELLIYASGTDANIKKLYNRGIMTKLMELLYNESQQVLGLTIKILDVLIDYDEPIDFFQLELQAPHITRITKVFLTTTNKYIKEYTTKILSTLADKPQLLQIIVQEKIDGVLWETIKTTKEALLQLYSLTLFSYLTLSCNYFETFLKINNFSLKYLMCFVNSEYEDIQNVGMDIQYRISKCTNKVFLEKVISEKITESTVKILLDPNKSHFQNKVLEIISSYMKHHDNASEFVKTLEFIQLSRWVHSCDDRCLVLSAQIFEHITRFRDLLQLLTDFSVDRSILSLFRTNEYPAICKLTLTVARMSDHVYCCETLATETVMTALLGVLSKDEYAIPYKIAAINTIHNFFLRFNESKRVFATCEGIPTVVNLYKRARSRLANEIFFKLMDIMHVFAVIPGYREDLMSKDLYKTLFEQFLLDTTPELATKAIAILACYNDDKILREYFIEIKGPKRITKQIQRFSRNINLLNSILVFLRNFCSYRSVAMVFLREDITMALKNVSEDVQERLPAIKTTLDMFYGLYLPLKFFETGRLEIEDKLRDSSFYVIYGHWDSRFPFYDDLHQMKLSITTTFYLVSFSTPADRVLCKVKSPANISEFKNSKQLYSVSGILKRKNSQSNFKATDKDTDELTNTFLNLAKRIPPKFNYGCIQPDPYISVMIEQTYLNFCNDRSLGFVEKIRLLAKYVVQQLSGGSDSSDSDKNTPLKRQSYSYHVNTLKQKIGINVIPIGFLKMGGYCERALLFKVLADQIEMPCTLVKGTNLYYWNEVPLTLPENENGTRFTNFAVVDLMKNVSNLYMVGSEEAQKYCGFTEVFANLKNYTF